MKASIKKSWLQMLIYRNEISRISLVKAVVGVTILLSLISFDAADPSPLNLVNPFGGIQNLLSLPGALLAGFLIESFGYLSFSIPILLVLTGRKKSSFSIKLLLPEVLELLTLVTIIGFLTSSKSSEQFQWVGLWGHISSQHLIEFPGKIISLVALVGYQFVYFKENRIDLSLFSLLSLVFFLAFRFLSYLFSLINKNIDKSSKYYIINWITPFGYAIIKHLENIGARLKGKTELFRYRLTGIDPVSAIGRPIQLITRRKIKAKPVEDSLQIAPAAEVQNVDKTFVMQETMRKYKELYYDEDQVSFLIHEEEIVV